MSAAILDQIYRLTEQLTPEENLQLIEHLQAKMPQQFDGTVTRDMLLAEHERLKAAGAFDNIESLYGKYANPDAPDLSEEALHATIREIRDQWDEL